MTAFWGSKKWTQQPSQGPRARRRAAGRFRPQIETLEDRRLLATCTVIDLGDAGAGDELRGDLRYCLNTLNAAPAPDNRIVFEPGLAGTVELARGALTVTTDLEILGPGADVLAVSGGHRDGVFHIPDDPRVREVRLADLTVTAGIGIPRGSGRSGGGLFNLTAAVTLTRVTLTGNTAAEEGGGAYNVFGTLVFNSCTLSDNRARSGGGLSNTNGTAILNDSVVVGNFAQNTGGIFNRRWTTLNRSVVTGNYGERFGGGIGNTATVGGLTVIESLIAGNVAPSLGFAGGIDNNASRVAVVDSTIRDNFGAGLRNRGSATITGSTLRSGPSPSGCSPRPRSWRGKSSTSGSWRWTPTATWRARSPAGSASAARTLRPRCPATPTSRRTPAA